MDNKENTKDSFVKDDSTWYLVFLLILLMSNPATDNKYHELEKGLAYLRGKTDTLENIIVHMED